MGSGIRTDVPHPWYLRRSAGNARLSTDGCEELTDCHDPPGERGRRAGPGPADDNARHRHAGALETAPGAVDGPPREAHRRPYGELLDELDRDTLSAEETAVREVVARVRNETRRRTPLFGATDEAQPPSRK
ncbi:hypothetical protein JCM17823_29600 [Halorubrum gandharaense]